MDQNRTEQKEVDQGSAAGMESGKKREAGKRRSIGGVLTERDRTACLWVCEQGVMTVEQLWRAVWWTPESRSPRYAYDRALFLERNGFLEGIRSPHSLKTYFKASRLAQEAASQLDGGLALVPLHSPPINEIGHADGLTELRLAVLRSGRMGNSSSTKPWRTDRVLMIDPEFPRERFYQHLPDAIWLTPSGNRIALEYERTRKVFSRVRTKVEAFSRELARPDRTFDRVLWISAPGALSVLSQALASHPEQTLRTMDQFLAELKEKVRDV